MSSKQLDEQMFGEEYSGTEAADLAIEVAEAVQAFYMSGSTSKRPYGLTIVQLVTKIMKGGALPEL